MLNNFSIRSLALRSLSLALVMLALSAASMAQFRVAIAFGPPALPVYVQPVCPGEGYIWTPGYWSWDDDAEDYYWVPGTWVLAPEVGFLWTPPWWGWGGEAFIFHEGFWGPVIGFYGGINYGFGYFGEGYEGGRWENGRFFYNRSVTNVNVTVIRNVYNTRVVNENRVNRISYNGGNGGINARPTPQQEAAARERHLPPAAVQVQHAQAARTNPQQRASVNMGKPAVAATPKPGVFKDRAVVPAKAAGGSYPPPANRGGKQARGNASAPRPENRPENNASRSNAPPVHPRDLPPAARPSPPSTGKPKLDQKYQQQQEKQFAKQEQERQKLQQKQEQEHQRLSQRNADEARKQQVEQRHQQQTQQLQQRHEQQQQQLQRKQQPPPSRERSKPPKEKP